MGRRYNGSSPSGTFNFFLSSFFIFEVLSKGIKLLLAFKVGSSLNVELELDAIESNEVDADGNEANNGKISLSHEVISLEVGDRSAGLFAGVVHVGVVTVG